MLPAFAQPIHRFVSHTDGFGNAADVSYQLPIDLDLFHVQRNRQLVNEYPCIGVRVKGTLCSELFDLDGNVRFMQLVEDLSKIAFHGDGYALLTVQADRKINQTAFHRAPQCSRYTRSNPLSRSHLMNRSTVTRMSLVSSRR